MFDVEILARFIRLQGYELNSVENTIYKYPLRQRRAHKFGSGISLTL